jgi:hypothetical protein
MAAAQTPRDAIFQTILDMVADWLCLEWAPLALLTRDPVTCVPTSGPDAPSRELKQPPSLACDSIEALARPPCTADIGNRVAGPFQEPFPWNGDRRPPARGPVS